MLVGYFPVRRQVSCHSAEQSAPRSRCPGAGVVREVRSAAQLGFATAPAVSDATDHSRVGRTRVGDAVGPARAAAPAEK